MKQLDLFRNHLPKKPYCTNELGGLSIRTIPHAVNHRYIQHNHVNEKMWLVYDVDRSITPDEVDHDLLLPPPNLFIQNPENGHAHIAYSLNIPIHLNANSSQRVIRYAAAVDCAYQEALDADRGYAGLIMKNPLHTHWVTVSQTPESYDLGYMSEFVDLAKYKDRRKHLLNYGLGRNCTMFDKLRMWAYRQINNYRPHNQDGWFDAVFSQCEWINAQFEGPLPLAEVRATSKSVAKWVWRYYTPTINRGRDSQKTVLLDLPDSQVISALETNKARVEATESKIKSAVMALQGKGVKITQRAIAEVSGLGIATVKRHANKEFLIQYK